MHIDLKSALNALPLPTTASWPEGVWDKTVLEHGTMSVVVFAPRGRDYQTAHKRDELYIVMKGSGILMIEDTPHPFLEGDVLFVPAEKQHRFADFSQDLVTLGDILGARRRRKDIGPGAVSLNSTEFQNG